MSNGKGPFKYLPDPLFSLLERSKIQGLDTYRSIGTFVSSRIGLGTNIFTKDWDLLIILDTCRPDALRELQDEYDFIQEVDEITSVGGSSPEWMVNTFTTVYICL